MTPASNNDPFVRDLLGRGDYAIFSEIVAPQTCVLDLGCGDGELLSWLADNKDVDARGVEMDGAKVQKAIAKGVSCYQGDIEECLADYPDHAFDYVILSQTLQEVRQPLQVLNDMLRVGRRALVAFPNFGHWRVRLAHLFTGRAPKQPGSLTIGSTRPTSISSQSTTSRSWPPAKSGISKSAFSSTATAR